MDQLEDATVSAPVETTPTPAQDAPKPEAAKSEAAEASKLDERSSEQKLDDELRKTFRRANRPDAERGEDGKFLSKDGKPKLPPAQIEAEGKTPVDPNGQKPDAAKEPAAPAIPPPQSWSADAKAKWAQLPPEVQQVVARRETEAHTAISDLGQKAKAFDSLNEVIQPHMERIKGANERPATYVRNMLVADQMLERDPVGFIKFVAQQKGIDLGSISDPFAQQDPQAGQWEARNSALQAHVARLEQQLEQIGQRVSGREQAEQDSQLSHYNKMIDDFAASKADWNDIGGQALAFAIQHVRAENPDMPPQEIIQQAYDRARWANPATRQKLLAQQQAEAEAKRLEAARTAASQAKRAGAINVNGTAPQRARASLDDDLRSVWRRNHAN